jgi:serine phosphatase RsbU (regulator of sigma subunit)
VAFGQERLLATAQANLELPAQQMQETLLAATHQFVAEAPQFDDITLMVLRRT